MTATAEEHDRYFPDVEAIPLAWHERQITGHLAFLAELRDRSGAASERQPRFTDSSK
ncbi:hypothetical protein [Streptosporangium roseum]|uniref:hypothetical protein n=1 Tax=Streptosporangium roseum TaxID=2001 RepID=UPI00331BB369